jgi:arylsulfatase A-like enzyme
MPVLSSSVRCLPPTPRFGRAGAALAVATLLGAGCSGDSSEGLVGEDLPLHAIEPAPPNRVAEARLPLNPPNVLLIVVDTLRADHLSCNGSLRTSTPNLDALAASGVNFRTAVSTTPNTVLSMASLLTSTYPATNGVEWQLSQLGDWNLTFAEILRDAGYATGAVVGNGVLRAAQGFGQGFEKEHYLLRNSDRGGPITDAALQAVDVLGRDGKPFFLWVHYLDPHWPYDPPAEFEARHVRSPAAHERARSWLARVGQPGTAGVALEVAFFRNPLEDAVHQEARGLYEAEVESLDAEIGRLLEGLAARSLAERTLVVLTADHGESLGEHGLYYTHDPYVYDADTRIPMIWRGPAANGFRAGLVVANVVRQIDVVPTITDLLGIRLEREVEGESLLPLLCGETELEPRLAFQQSVPLGLEPEVKNEYAERPRIWRKGPEGVHRAVRTDDWRLVAVPVAEGTRFELYHVASDPNETWNLVEARTYARNRVPPAAAEMERELLEELRAWGGFSARTGDVPEMDEETRRHLEGLGYISPGGATDSPGGVEETSPDDSASSPE